MYNFCNVKASSVRTVLIAHPGHKVIDVQSVNKTRIETELSTKLNEISGTTAYETNSTSDYVSDHSRSQTDDSDDEEDVRYANFGSLVDHKMAAASLENADCNEKLLVFTCGSETFTPHQIGIKRIVASDSSCLLKPEERPDDVVDHIIEMSGHIVGMNLSPDHRY